MQEAVLKRYESRLIDLRERLRSQMNSLVEKSNEHLRTEGDVPADHDEEGYAEELTLIHNERALLEHVNEALARLTAGTYGTCVTCGGRIAAARLDAAPYVTECVACAAKESAS